MGWTDLKAGVLAGGGCRIEGQCPPGAIARSTAGPGAGGAGAVFFSSGGRRVRIALGGSGPAVMTVRADGNATLRCGSETIEGRVEPVGLHCPRQAFVTVSESCVYDCVYCPVPGCRGPRKTVEEIVDLVGAVAGSIDAIALTSGVAISVEEEEEYVCQVVAALGRFGLPIGVSIYPTPSTPTQTRCTRRGRGQVQPRGGHARSLRRRSARVSPMRRSGTRSPLRSRSSGAGMSSRT